MPKPTDGPVDWDTNDTNSTEPATGLQDDGYADGDVPTAAEINYQFQQLGEWSTYVDDHTTANGAWAPDAVTEREITIGSNAFSWQGGLPGLDGHTLNASLQTGFCQISDYLPNGAVIKELDCRIDRGTANTMEAELSTVDFTASGTPTVSSLETNTSTASLGDGSIVMNTFVDPTVDKPNDAQVLRIEASTGAGGTSDVFYYVIVTYDDPSNP